jgi:Ca-activated chloride channel family protein
MTDVAFSLDAAFDRPLFWEQGGSVRYLVTRLSAGSADFTRQCDRAPLNIALVIDASGSMDGGKLAAAKAAAIGLAERLDECDRLTVVSFASDVRIHLDALAMTPANLVTARHEIGLLATRGMTDLSGGWFAGVECAARIAEHHSLLTPRIIILSDGHANKGITSAAELREHAGELRLRGVLTSCLGIGDGYDEHLLRGIAENGGGRLHDAELTSEISAVLLGELEDICGTMVDDASIALTIPPGVDVEALGITATQRNHDRLVVNLGPVQHGVPRVLVLKVVCPPVRAGGAIGFALQASGRSREIGTIIQSNPVEAQLTAAEGSANGRQPRDLALAEVVARHWSASIVAAAARLNRDRAFREAEAWLEQQLRHFRRYVEGIAGGAAMVREIELLAQRVGREFSSRVSKELVLQSSLVMESRLDRRGDEKAAWAERMWRGE